MPTSKPIDRWLAVGGAVVGVILYLLPKTPLVVAVCCLLIFLLLLHPVWNFWWIEGYRPRQVFMVVVLAVLCIVLGRLAWPEPIRPGPTPTEARLSEIEKTVKGLGEKYTREELLQKYPAGYVVFGLDYTNSVFPRDQQKLLDGFELDWKGVGFISVTKDRYELRLPSVLKNGQLLLGNPIVSGPMRVDGLSNGFAVGDTVVAAEILEITDKGMVFVIGFKRVPGLNSSK